MVYCSFCEVINVSNNSVGVDIIVFNIIGIGFFVIELIIFLFVFIDLFIMIDGIM